MKRVETSEATTSRGAEGVGPAGLATPPEPGVTWSVVLGVSEGGGKEGRATSLVWEGEEEGGKGRRDGRMGEGTRGREGDSGSVGGEGRNITCERNRLRRGKELKWKWQWNEGKEGNKKKKKKQNNNNVTKKRLLVWQGTTEIKHFYYIHKADKYKHNTRGLHMQVYTQLSNVEGVGAEHKQRHTFHFHRTSCQSFVV